MDKRRAMGWWLVMSVIVKVLTNLTRCGPAPLRHKLLVVTTRIGSGSSF